MNKISGLYAITPDIADTAMLLHLVQDALEGGTNIVQYRNKQADLKLKLEQALSLLVLCEQFHVPLIINDDVSLAKEIDAAGVHLGVDDTSIEHARSVLGRKKIIGMSCYNQIENALDAQTRLADYVAFGSFFPSPTKPKAVRANLSLLKDFKRYTHIPVVAIGGISVSTAPEIIREGADAIAISSALFDAPDITATAYSFSKLFSRSQHAVPQPTTI